MHKSYLKDMSYERVLSSVDNKGAKSIVSADTQKAQKPVNISTMFQAKGSHELATHQIRFPLPDPAVCGCCDSVCEVNSDCRWRHSYGHHFPLVSRNLVHQIVDGFVDHVHAARFGHLE